MSGKDNKELKNTALGDSRLPIVAVKPLRFGHHADANETGINFSSLVWESQDTIDTGISNPTATEILNAHLNLYGAGVVIKSSFRGILSEVSYKISSTGVTWKNFATEQDELFTFVCNNTWRTSLQCVDADVLNETGVLVADEIEIDFIKVIKLPRPGQPSPIIVLVDESSMYMNTNNSATNLDGDFYIKDMGNGFGRSIVMNTSSSSPRNYQITGAGVIPQSAEANVLQKIETLYSMYETLAADMALETGNPLSRYFTAPNSVDLAYFGDLVRSILDVEIPQTTEWTSWTPTGSWTTNVTYTGKRQRRGDREYFQVLVTCSGAPDAVNLTVILPSDITLDTGKLMAGPDGWSTLEASMVKIRDNGISTNFGYVNILSGVIYPSVAGASGSYMNSSGITSTIPFTFGAGDYVLIDFSVPVLGRNAKDKIRTILGV